MSSIGVGFYQAVSQKNASDKATEANLSAAQMTRDLNREMFDRSRGAYGNAFLPEYFNNYEDQTLGVDARNAYQASKDALGDPWQQEFKYRTLRNQFNPDFAAANQTASDIFNGGITNQRTANLAPVSRARLNVAGQQRQAYNQAMNERMNAIRATQQRQGFTGDSTFQQNRLLSAGLSARERAAQAQSAAELQNAQDLRDIQDSGIQLRLSNLDLPYQRAQQAISFEQLPVDIMQGNQGRSLRPFEFFRMGQTPYRYDPLPQVGASPNALGLLAGALNTQGSAVGQYFAQRNMANQQFAQQQQLLAQMQQQQNYGRNPNYYSVDPEASYFGGMGAAPVYTPAYNGAGSIADVGLGEF